jgi:hypothetical protein
MNDKAPATASDAISEAKSFRSLYVEMLCSFILFSESDFNLQIMEDDYKWEGLEHCEALDNEQNSKGMNNVSKLDYAWYFMIHRIRADMALEVDETCTKGQEKSGQILWHH